MRSPSAPLFAMVVACYRCLADCARARRILAQCLPAAFQEDPMIDAVFDRLPEVLRNFLAGRAKTKNKLVEFLHMVRMERDRGLDSSDP